MTRETTTRRTRGRAARVSSGVVSEPVTVTVARRVAPGREEEFEQWAAELTRAAAGFPGFLGAGLLRPGRVGESWHVVFRFDSPEHLDKWESSEARADLLNKGDDVVEATAMHRISGLETWFSLPGRTAPAPPKWKMFVVSLAAVFSLQLILSATVGRLVDGWASPWRLLLIATLVIGLMTWAVMPVLVRWLQAWLFGLNHSAGGADGSGRAARHSSGM